MSVGAHPVSLLERQGSDPPVLLLHGWGASAATFAVLLSRARTGRRLVAIDLPGFGETQAGSANWSRELYADLVSRLIAEQGWGTVSLLGHSYGGGVAIRLAAAAATPVDRLLLCAPSGVRLPGSRAAGARVQTFRLLRSGAERALPSRWSEPAVEWLRQRMGSADYRAAGPLLRPILVRAVAEDLSELATTIRVPTLVLWGARDQELPLATYGRRLAELVPPAELIELPSSGHFPFVDDPGRFAAVFDSFVDAKL
ncbi:MAG TPA: alpha/beta hydrolase [Candidatus Dormibacteraeota bacterium]